ncbi:hypothetical protein [Leptothoe spongobia]|uniref:Uncharacterized protein n=1 Tax=Leptothoe spongobia TAU-MAC 1115 TaxID=1967444 RepID=A0A947DFE4_9CYAN|nr:hypothetical protein [Leptothoe spongobia]MBT9315765.1 hypothetical protein [Leptothoe spongobia TAU-MAC 1115]
MTFDINALQNCDGDWHEALNAYTDELVELFAESPEGQAHYEKYQHIGWSARLISLGFTYQEVTLPDMLDDDVEAILFSHFPRKISLMSPDDADDVIPELIAFWQYLQREYQLPNAEDILNFLQAMDPQEFLVEMNNPANFGMAKSFFQGGMNAGFDMTTEEGAYAFQSAYNASLSGSNSPFNAPFGEPLLPETPELETGKATRPKKSKTKQKRRKALAKASRKQNRKKRK